MATMAPIAKAAPHPLLGDSDDDDGDDRHSLFHLDEGDGDDGDSNLSLSR